MGLINLASLWYLRREDIFADAINVGVLGGKQKVKAENLSELDPVLGVILPARRRRGRNYMGEGATFAANLRRAPLSAQGIERRRDLLKKVVIKQGAKATYLILGIESQSYVDYAMPVRILLYDALTYLIELKLKAARRKKWKKYGNKDEFLSEIGPEDKITPIVTLVVVFSPEKWTGPRCLSDMFTEVDESLKPYVQDYKIPVLSAAELGEQDRSKFKTDLGDLLYAIKLSKDKEAFGDFLKSSTAMRHLSYEARVLLKEVTHAKYNVGDEEESNMYSVWDDMENTARQEGRKEGRKEGIDIGEARGEARGEIKGIFSSQLKALRNIMRYYRCTLEQAFEVLVIPLSMQEEYRVALERM